MANGSSSSSTCPYTILGVSRDASPRTIERAWRQKARVHHPDKAPDAEKEAAEESFKQLAEAHELLADPTRRKLYDSFGIQDSAFARDADGPDEDYMDANNFADLEEMLNQLNQMFQGGPGPGPVEPAEERDLWDVWEGVLGFTLLSIGAGALAGLVWFSRRPPLSLWLNWCWWRWRFLLFDFGLG